jgi:hypothetical protein
MERTYRASNGVFLYTLFLALDTLVLGWDGVGRLRRGLPLSGVVLVLLAVICAACAIALLWRWGRVRVIITPDALLVRGEAPVRRVYWADVDRVRELRGPAYQLSLRHLLPGPYLPHTLLRGETVLEVLARPGMRVVLRQALVDGYGSLKEDVLRLISKTAEVDLHGRWWRE